MKDLKITINNEDYDTEWIIDWIKLYDAEGYEESTEKEKEEWVISEFKQLAIKEINRHFGVKKSNDSFVMEMG